MVQGVSDRSRIGASSEMRLRVGRLLVGVLTVLIASPVAFVVFAMSLLVAEVVMFPTATLAIAVIAGLVASWAARMRAGDGNGPDVNAVISRNLMWAIVPASVSPFLAMFPVGAVAIAVLYTGIGATRLAFRHRRPKRSISKDLALWAMWLAGTGLGVAVILIVASQFGLTGA